MPPVKRNASRTSDGSSWGMVTDITKFCPQSTIPDGLAVRGGDAKSVQNEISELQWELWCLRENCLFHMAICGRFQRRKLF